MAATISAAVGQGGANRRGDVLEVQKLLNAVAPIDGGPEPKLDPDGWIGPLTIGAIRKFQQRQFGWADGRVDVGNVTIKKLNELADKPCPDGPGDGRTTCRVPRPIFSLGSITIESVTPPAPPPPPPPVDPLTLARQDAPTAILWARAAAQTLERAINQLLDAGNRALPSGDEFVKANTHFHVGMIPSNFEREVLLDRARLYYLDIIRVLSDPDFFFRAGDNTDPRAYAYAYVGTYYQDKDRYKLYYNNTYSGCGPKCRCAMVLHECGHYVAKAIHYAREGPKPTGQADIPFPDAHGNGPIHPRSYAQLFPTEALHNACTYPAFAYHCFTGQDDRPGADRISE